MIHSTLNKLRRHACGITIALTAALIGPALAQDTPAVQDFAGLKLLQPDDTNIMLMGDLFPVVRRVLSSPSVQQILKDGRLGQVIAAQSGHAIDALSLLQIVEGQSQHIPTEIMMAYPDSTVAQFGHLGTAYLQMALAHAMQLDAGDAVKDLPRLQKELLAELKQIQIPRLTLWVRFRTPGDVRLAMGAVRVQATNMRQNLPPATHITVTTQRVALSVKVADQVDPTTLGALLLRFGVLDDPDSDIGKAIIGALQELSISVAVDMAPDGLKVTLSPQELPPATGLPAAAMGTLWKPQPSLLVYTNSNIKAMRDALAEVDASWKSWANTPAGKALVNLDQQHLLDSFSNSMGQMDQAGTQASMRLWADDALHVEAIDDTTIPHVPVADAPWIKMIPLDSQAVGLSGGPSLGQQLPIMFDRIDQQMANLPQPEVRMLRGQIDAEFKGLRDAIAKMPALFAPTTALILTSQGKLQKLGITAPQEGKPKTVTLENIGVMEMAVLSVATDGPAAQDLMGEIARQFAKGILAVTHKDQPNPAVLHEEDLGLGVKTYVLDSTWLTDMAKPDEVKLTIEGDLRPHFFAIDNVVIMSTSPRLSKAIIAAAKAGKKYPVPAGTIEFSRMDGSAIVGGLTIVADIVRQFSTQMAALGADAGDSADVKTAVDVITGLAEFATLLDKVDSLTIREGTLNHTTGQMTFQAGHLIK